jgi:hypothetical protein
MDFDVLDGSFRFYIYFQNYVEGGFTWVIDNQIGSDVFQITNTSGYVGDNEVGKLTITCPTQSSLPQGASYTKILRLKVHDENGQNSKLATVDNNGNLTLLDYKDITITLEKNY